MTPRRWMLFDRQRSSTTVPELVQHSQRQPLEIISFRMMQAYRVIHGVPQLSKDGDFTSRIDGGAKHHLLEQVRREML